MFPNITLERDRDLINFKYATTFERYQNFRSIPMPLPKIKKERKYTYKDYFIWPDNERWELIDGIAYSMTLSPSRIHQKISRELLTIFNAFLSGKECEVYGALFDVRLPESDESDDEIITVVQPDILVVCDKSKLDDRGCRGAPDLIIEILSPSTIQKDMREKFSLYERVGVKEYWMAHPDDRNTMVFMLGGDGTYRKPDIYFDGDKINVGALEGLEVDLEFVFKE